MSQHYVQICVEDRNFIHRHLILGRSLIWIAGQLGRAVSTMSREVLRNRGLCGGYDAGCQGAFAETLPPGACEATRGKLPARACVRTDPQGLVATADFRQPSLMSAQSSPDPIGRVSHETIYQAIHVLPRGEIRKEIIGFLRQGRKLRRPRSAGKDPRKCSMLKSRSHVLRFKFETAIGPRAVNPGAILWLSPTFAHIWRDTQCPLHLLQLAPTLVPEVARLPKSE